MSCLNKIDPNLLILLNALVAVGISDDLSATDLNVLGNFIAALGALLLTKAAQMEARKPQEGTEQQLAALEKEHQALKSILAKILNTLEADAKNSRRQ